MRRVGWAAAEWLPPLVLLAWSAVGAVRDSGVVLYFDGVLGGLAWAIIMIKSARSR